MRLLFFIIIFFKISILFSQNEKENAKKYFQLVDKAEKYLIASKNNKALDCYELAFSIKDVKFFGADKMNATLLAFEQNDTSALQLLVKKSKEFSSIASTEEFIQSFLNTPFYDKYKDFHFSTAFMKRLDNIPVYNERKTEKELLFKNIFTKDQEIRNRTKKGKDYQTELRKVDSTSLENVL